MGGKLGTIFARFGVFESWREPAMGHLAYDGDDGPQVAYRFERFNI